jgi:hypothetical protein
MDCSFTMLKPCRVKCHALFGISTQAGSQKGSSKRGCRTLNKSNISQLAKLLGHQDVHPLKVNVILLHLVVMKNSNTIRAHTTEQIRALNFILAQKQYNMKN